jgi:hypothetical protein
MFDDIPADLSFSCPRCAQQVRRFYGPWRLP